MELLFCVDLADSWWYDNGMYWEVLSRTLVQLYWLIQCSKYSCFGSQQINRASRVKSYKDITVTIHFVEQVFFYSHNISYEAKKK